MPKSTLLLEWPQSKRHLSAQEMSAATEFIPELYSAVPKYLRWSRLRKQRLLWLTASGVPAHSLGVPLLQACDEEEHPTESQEGVEGSIPSKDTPPMTSLPPTRPHLLKLLPIPSSLTDW